VLETPEERVEIKEEQSLTIHVDMGTQADLILEPTITKEEEPPPQFSKPVEEPVQIPVAQPVKQHKPSRTESKREAPVHDPSKPRAWSSVVGGVTSGGLPGQNNAPIAEPVVNNQELREPEEEIVTAAAAGTTTVVSADKPKASRPEVLNSLYVSNLGAGCDVEEIKELFSRYGKVKTIKYTSPQSYCFVDYESAESADKALKGGPIKLGEYDLKMERRKTSVFPSARGRGGGSRGRGAGRGRGGPPREARPEARTTDRTERREPRGEPRPREGNDRRPPNKEGRGDDRGGRAGRGRGGGARVAPPAASS